MYLGKSIRRMRRDKGWTQGDLAERAGIKIKHVSKPKQDGTDPNLSTLYKLMHAFSCSPDPLLLELNRVSTDATRKQTLERATTLPEDDKLATIKVVNGYRVAAGFANSSTQSIKNKLPFNLSWYREPVKAVLDDQQHAEREATKHNS